MQRRRRDPGSERSEIENRIPLLDFVSFMNLTVHKFIKNVHLPMSTKAKSALPFTSYLDILSLRLSIVMTSPSAEGFDGILGGEF